MNVMCILQISVSLNFPQTREHSQIRGLTINPGMNLLFYTLVTIKYRRDRPMKQQLLQVCHRVSKVCGGAVRFCFRRRGRKRELRKRKESLVRGQLLIKRRSLIKAASLQWQRGMSRFYCALQGEPTLNTQRRDRPRLTKKQPGECDKATHKGSGNAF